MGEGGGTGGYNGEQQETVGRFMSLSVSKPTTSICFICIVLWSTGALLVSTYADCCCCCSPAVLYHMNTTGIN